MIHYQNHKIKEENDKFFTILTCQNGEKVIEVTNLRAGQKLITRYNNSILSDEEFLEDIARKDIFKIVGVENERTR